LEKNAGNAIAFYGVIAFVSATDRCSVFRVAAPLAIRCRDVFVWIDSDCGLSTLPSMLRAVSRLAVAATLICAIGGNWALLQSIAWTGMVISYSHDAGWKEALKKTFDGKHPCQLCKAVAEGKKSENRQASQKSETKLDFFCSERSLAPHSE